MTQVVEHPSSNPNTSKQITATTNKAGQVQWLTAAIPATMEERSGGSQFQANPGKMLAEHSGHACNPSYAGGIDKGDAIWGWTLSEK
jgi:hypothetical protein